MAVGKHGWGSQLTMGTTTSAVANIISLSSDGPKRAVLDVSTMDSANTWSEFIPGMLDAGQLTVNLMYDGTTVSQILHQQMTATATTFKVWFNDHTTATSRSSITAVGFISDLGEELPFEDKITQSVTIKLTGTPTWAAKTA